MNTFQNLNAELKHGLNDTVLPDLDLSKRSNCGKCALGLKGLTLMLVWAKYQSSILNTSAVIYTFQNLNAKLKHGCKQQSKN